jgi:hypothetical protein
VASLANATGTTCIDVETSRKVMKPNTNNLSVRMKAKLKTRAPERLDSKVGSFSNEL